MGRKKKTKTEVTQRTGIAYEGQVTLSIKKNGKIISSYKYKNHGGTDLWEFLCACVANKYSEAKAYNPAKIRLYHASAVDPNTIIGAEPNILQTSTALSQVVSAKTVREICKVGTYGRETVLHFQLPASVINIQQTAELNTVNQIVLYSESKNRADTEPISGPVNYCAYYLTTKEVNNTLDWDSTKMVDLNNVSGNYTILIDWEMSFINK